MAKRQRRKSQGRGLPLGASIVIIAILAVAAVALSYLAFQNLNDPNPEGFATTNTATPESSILAPAESEEPDAPPEAPVSEQAPETKAANTGEQIELVAQSRLIVLDGSLGVRADVGECTNPGSIEFSTDGGQSWTPSSTFDATSATQILRILPANGGTTFVVALNGECEPWIYSTSNNGTTWNGPLSAVGTWYLNPAAPATLGAPGGAKTIACEALGLSPVTDREVGVLCADGSIITTTDGGTTWSDSAPVDGAIALAYSKQNLSAVTNGDGQTCSGMQLLNLGTDGGTEQVSCVEIVDLGSLAAGDIAAAQSGNTLVLWVGENQYISTDGGQTWL